METAELLTRISLPKKFSSNRFVIAEKFKDETNRYLTFLEDYNDFVLDNEKNEKVLSAREEIITTAHSVVEKLDRIFYYYERADFKIVQETMDSLMNQLKDDLFTGVLSDRVMVNYNGKLCFTGFRTTRGQKFYRIRAVDSKSKYIEENTAELFHIPLSKRAYSNNERFSLAGFPGLYLSTMLPLAWQECGYPKQYYYSQYEYVFEKDFNTKKIDCSKELNLLMFYSPIEMREWGEFVKHTNFESIIKRYLKSYPLILACSFVNQSGKVPYKQEYIVPQLLMQWIQRNNSTVQGIEYFSCVDMQTQSRKWCAYNIAIPALPPFDECGYSIRLKKKFRWTKPCYYKLPIFEAEQTEKDRKFLYDVAETINNVMRSHMIAEKYVVALCTMQNIVGCLMSTMEKQGITDVQLVLQILDALSQNISYIEQQQLIQNIEEKIKNETYPMTNAEIIRVSNAFEKAYFLVVSKTAQSISVENIIEEYRKSCWNLHV